MSTIQADLVSTIIPVFNRPVMIVAAVQSVLEQEYRPIEIIIVDDGSDDDTPVAIGDLVAQHPEVIGLRQDNAGPGVAREYGRQHAQGEFIQYLDSDDVLLPEKFALQVSALKQEPDCDVAYGKTDFRVIGTASQMEAYKGTGLETKTMFPAFLKSRWWGTSTPLHRRSVTDKVGAWLPIINEEDWEYDCRVAALGGKLVYVNEFVSVTQSHDSHLCDKGSSDPIKLRDRCTAREHMYRSALNSMVVIPDEIFQFFAKAVFLLARECAAQNLDDCVRRMLILAKMARGRSSAKQLVFTTIGNIFGWPAAAKIAQLVQ